MIFLLSIFHTIKLFTEKSVVRIWSSWFDHQKHIISLNLNAPEYWGLQLQLPLSGKLNTCHLLLHADPSMTPSCWASNQRLSLIGLHLSLFVIISERWSVKVERTHSISDTHLMTGTLTTAICFPSSPFPYIPQKTRLSGEFLYPVGLWMVAITVSHQVTERTHSCFRC